MAENVLEMRRVTKRFPGVVALSDVNIHLGKGEILGICGENGAGKSTLMKILSGSYPAGSYDGEILIDGQAVKMTSTQAASALGIEMVYQEINVMLDASVAENMFVGNLPVKGVLVNFALLYQWTRERLESIHLDMDPSKTVRGLSSGQMQMIALMRACAKNPRILVLDEPTSALTDTDTDIMMNLLDSLREQGVSCVYISHKLEEVFRICDRVLVMRDGQTVSSYPTGEVTKDKLVEDMVGRKVENFYPKIDVEPGEEVLRVEGLTVPHPAIADRNIVENISFNLRKGEILGVGGLVGAGRSEMLGAIFGQITKGVSKKVYLKGKEVRIRSPFDAINAGLGFLTEDRKRNGIIWMLGILENLTLACLPDLPGKIFINKKVERNQAGSIFNRLSIKAPSLETQLVTLSGGNQQKVVMGKWLLKKPEILFIDEPTRGIDVGAKAEIYKLMGELAHSGVSIIMVSSDMPELIAISDRCLVLSDGRITGEFVGEEITDEAIMRAAIV
jgi:ABC-type sugar transport system ATPase subunit